MDRREFFKRIAVVGTLASLTPSALYSKEAEQVVEVSKSEKPKTRTLKPLGEASILRKFDPVIGWMDIGYVNAIDLPIPEPIDITCLDSEEGYRDFYAQYKRHTKISMDAAFSQYTWEIVKSDFKDDLSKSYEILLPDGTSLEFEGLVTEIPLTVPMYNNINCNIILTIIDNVFLNT
jgi:hypothetical protein